MSVGNLALRVGLPLAILAAAIGMTAAASESVTHCSTPPCAAASAPDTQVRPDGPADIAVSAGEVSRPATEFAHTVTSLAALVTALVFLAVFAILLSYRPRPGGVRPPHR